MTQRRIIKNGLVSLVACLSGNALVGQVLGGQFQLTRNVYAANAYTVTAEARVLFRYPVPSIAYLKINWGDGSPEDSLPFVKDVIDGGNKFGIKYFSGVHTYSQGAVCTLTAGGINFASGFQNIPNSQAQKFVLRGMINQQVLAAPPVSTFETYMRDTVPCNFNKYDDYFANAGMSVPSPFSDSLAYSIDHHPEISGYVAPPVGINNSGTITFTANAAGNYNVSYKVDTWRKNTAGVYDKITGTSYVEILLSACNINTPPATTGIESMGVKDGNFLKVFPNPADNIVIVSTDIQGEKHVSLLDVAGKQLFHKQETSERFSLDMSDYEGGVYFLFVRTQTGLLTRKIVKE